MRSDSKVLLLEYSSSDVFFRALRLASARRAVGVDVRNRQGSNFGTKYNTRCTLTMLCSLNAVLWPTCPGGAFANGGPLGKNGDAGKALVIIPIAVDLANCIPPSFKHQPAGIFTGI